MNVDITYEQLREAVSGGAVALRSSTSLQPAGGTDDKVFPPTYLVGPNEKTKYAIEDRSGKTAVLLNSVAAEANRAELALLDGWKSGALKFPVPYVDFTQHEDIDYEKLTVLETPHRIADAIFRDSLLDGTLFRLSDVGRAITNTTPRNAIALYKYSPTSILFGMWDSTGPKGGLGSKFQRSYVSEIMGFDASVGVKVSSRIDPLQIERLADEDRIYNHNNKDEVWTTEEDEAEKDKHKKPVYAARGSDGKPGQPSKINHGNIPPQIDSTSGGVTISGALQTILLSFVSLRRLQFKDVSAEASINARTAIAALGIAAIAYQYANDYDLRSRCLLIPTGEPTIELLKRDGSNIPVNLTQTSTTEILDMAVTRAAESGLGWETDNDKLALVPAPKLLELIRRSRKVSKDMSSDE